MRRATRRRATLARPPGISIHALHEESDRPHPAFQHRPRISIHALHEESDHLHSGIYPARHISIHALHEESDLDYTTGLPKARISIHALHEESDLCRVGVDIVARLFQSTLSMRRATRTSAVSSSPQRNFNPRSP